MAFASSAGPGSREPAGPGSGEPAEPSADEALRRLEQRLERASEAAEALIAQAAGAAARGAAGLAAAAGRTDSGDGGAPNAGGDGPGDGDGPGIPPAGWQVPRAAEDKPASDLELLLRALGAVRDLIPPELQQRLAQAVRELLMAVRALIDWYLERVERRPAQSSEPQDIPIL